MYGITSSEILLSVPVSTGTARHARTRRPSCAAMWAMPALAASRSRGSGGRKAMPTAYEPWAGSSAATTGEERVGGSGSGSRHRRRAAVSVPVAPRWSRLRAGTPRPLLDDVVRSDPVEAGDEADATGVVFERGVVEALSGRPSERHADRGSPSVRAGLRRLGHEPRHAFAELASLFGTTHGEGRSWLVLHNADLSRTFSVRVVFFFFFFFFFFVRYRGSSPLP